VRRVFGLWRRRLGCYAARGSARRAPRRGCHTALGSLKKSPWLRLFQQDLSCPVARYAVTDPVSMMWWTARVKSLRG